MRIFSCLFNITLHFFLLPFEVLLRWFCYHDMPHQPILSCWQGIKLEWIVLWYPGINFTEEIVVENGYMYHKFSFPNGMNVLTRGDI